MRKLLLFSSTLIAIAAACGGGSSSIDPLKYDRSCTNANDCVAIVTDACGCGCVTAAIDVSAKAQYHADFAAAKNNCPSGGPAGCGAACAAYALGCSAGVCVLTPPPPVDAGAD